MIASHPTCTVRRQIVEDNSHYLLDVNLVLSPPTSELLAEFIPSPDEIRQIKGHRDHNRNVSTTDS